MTPSKYLRNQLAIALAIIEHEAAYLGIDKVKDRDLMDAYLFFGHGATLVRGIMAPVLIEKNIKALREHYPSVAALPHHITEPLPDFDELEIHHVRINNSSFPAPFSSPTLATEYGDIILTVPGQFSIELYLTFKAVVVIPKLNPEGGDVIKVDFNARTR